MSAILLAEQSVPVHMRLENRLIGLGHQVTSVSDVDLVDMVKLHPYDMILWDVRECNDLNREILNQIRLFSDVPLMIIRGRGTPEYSNNVFEDPFSSVLEVPPDDEALDNIINEHLREAYRRTHNIRLYEYKGLKLSSGSIKRAEMREKGLDLTVKEYMILSLLMSHRECIYTKSTLYEAVWRQPYTGDDNAVKIHISNLRSKLRKADPGEKYIETVWGLGYRLWKN